MLTQTLIRQSISFCIKKTELYKIDFLPLAEISDFIIQK